VLSGFKVTLIILACLCVLAAIAIGFVYLDKYVISTSPVSYRIGLLELMNAPEWISDELLEAVASAAGGKEFALDKGSAKFIAENLSQFEWLHSVQVRTTEKTLRVEAKYRRPLAVVNFSRAESRYLVWPGIDDPVLDEGYKGAIVLGHVPLSKLPLVEITGFSSRSEHPAGSVWRDEDVVSATELLAALTRMDQISTPEAPLLYEIASIDVSNFGGRSQQDEPHIVLYAKDKTPIYWGAAYGQSSRYLEAMEKEKVAALYTYYKEYGTVQGLSKGISQFIDLRQPSLIFPRPTD
jgi:hypothetical protein